MFATSSQPNLQHKFSWQREVLGPALALLLVTIALFWKIALSAEYSILSLPDNANQSYAWLQFAATEVRQGRLPLWNPFTQGGRNFIGEMQTAAFGPLQAMAYLAPPDAQGRVPIGAINWTILIGYWVAALLQYALCRYLALGRFAALLGAVCFAFSGFMGTRAAQQSNVFFSSVWLPAIVLFYLLALQSRDWWCRLAFSGGSGLFVALSVLSGHHQPGALAILSLCVTALFLPLRTNRSSPARLVVALTLLGVVVVMGLALSAVQSFPTLEYSRYAVRWLSSSAVMPDQRIDYEILSRHFALTPENLLGLVSPVLDTNPDGRVYFGILPLVLALVGLTRWRGELAVQLFALLAVISLLYSLGSFSLLHGLTNVALPGLDKLREAVRALLVTHFSLSILAAFGAGVFVEGKSVGRNETLRRASGILGAATAVGVLLVLLIALTSRFIVEKRLPYEFNEIVLAVVLLALSWGVTALASRLAEGTFLVCALMWAILLLDFGYLISSSILSRKEYDGGLRLYPERLYRETPAIDFLRSRPGQFRFYDADKILALNAGDVFRLQSVWGHGATAYINYFKFFSSDASLGSPVLDLLNVRYALTRGPARGWTEIWKDPDEGFRISENPRSLPRAWIVHRARPVPSLDQALRLIQSRQIDLRNEVLLEADSGLPAPHSVGDSSLSLEHWEPGYLRLTTKSSSPGYLVLSEVNYPGWQARLSDTTLEPRTANGVLMAFPLSPGEQRWDIRYRPSSFLWGAFATALSGAVLLAVGGALLWRRPQRCKAMWKVGLAWN